MKGYRSGALSLHIVVGLNPVELLICKRGPHCSPSNGERRSRDASRRVITLRNRPQRVQRATTRSLVRVPSLAPRGCRDTVPFSLHSSIGKGPISSSIVVANVACLRRFCFIWQKPTLTALCCSSSPQKAGLFGDPASAWISHF